MDTRPHLSPLRICENYPSIVTYVKSKSGEPVGSVYKIADMWYLTTSYAGWFPIQVKAKYDGFLRLLKLHRAQNSGVLP